LPFSSGFHIERVFRLDANPFDNPVAVSGTSVTIANRLMTRQKQAVGLSRYDTATSGIGHREPLADLG
jgi:hypothetical protein